MDSQDSQIKHTAKYMLAGGFAGGIFSAPVILELELHNGKDWRMIRNYAILGAIVGGIASFLPQHQQSSQRWAQRTGPESNTTDSKTPNLR